MSMSESLQAWAWCPRCDNHFGARVYRHKVWVPPEATHSKFRRQCPRCGNSVMMRIGGPVYRREDW